MDEQALLAAIAANPSEDTPREAYADWLTENGQAERAEFIRFQCRAARADAGSAERTALERAAATILGEHREQWEKAFTALGAWQIIWERGFPVGATVTAGTFIENGSRICDLAHTMTRVAIADAAVVVAALAQCPHLAQFTHLDLRGNGIGDAGAQALAASPHLTRLAHLDLSRSDMADAGARALAASPHLPRLAHLNLSRNSFGDPGAQALAASPHLTRLTHLDLSRNYIGPTGAGALADCPHLARLTYLDLSRNYIGRAGERALAESPHFHPDMHIHVTGFANVFRGFQAWAGVTPRVDHATSTGARLTDLPGRWRRQVEPKNQPPGADDTPGSERPRR